MLLAMPADHVITDGNAFRAIVGQGATLAEQGAVVTFGITPDAPETGYGYIEAGQAVGTSGACSIARFVEKPDKATAQTYLDASNYLWNSGIFMMRASVWQSAIDICRNDIATACRKAADKGSVDGSFVRVDREAFLACPSDSIDYAVMEQLTNAATGLPQGVVLPLSAGWSDVGAWESLWRVLPKDASGNIAQGDVLLDDCHDTLAFSGRGADTTASTTTASRPSTSWSSPAHRYRCRCTTTAPNTGSLSVAPPE